MGAGDMDKPDHTWVVQRSACRRAAPCEHGHGPDGSWASAGKPDNARNRDPRSGPRNPRNLSPLPARDRARHSTSSSAPTGCSSGSGKRPERRHGPGNTVSGALDASPGPWRVENRSGRRTPGLSSGVEANLPQIVIPAQAGTHGHSVQCSWVPARAGMTCGDQSRFGRNHCSAWATSTPRRAA